MNLRRASVLCGLLLFPLVPSLAPASPVEAASDPQTLTPVVPARVYESRTGSSNSTVDNVQEAQGRRQANEVTQVQIAGRAGVPTDASAAILNVTVIRADAGGFATVFPCGEEMPGSSTVNYGNGNVVANGAIVTLGTDGKVCVFTRRGADLAVDVTGYAASDSPLGTLTPARIFETRSGNGNGTADDRQAAQGRRSDGQITEVQVTGRLGVPDDALAALLNITAIGPSAQAFVSAFPCGSDQPNASTLNPGPGAVVANGAIVEIGDGGNVCVFTSRGMQLAVDLTGYVPAGASLGTLNPARVYETRPSPSTTVDGQSWTRTRAVAGEEYKVQLPFRAGVPIDIDAAVLNITAIRPDGGGFLTVFPCGEPRPNASTLNFRAGEIVANSVVVRAGEFGRVCVYVTQDMDLAIDVTGFTTAANRAASVSIGFASGCSARDDGSVWCWGEGNPNFEGLGSSDRPSYPVPVDGLADVTDVATGGAHACAVHSGGNVSCWGRNGHGQLGNDTTTDSATPVTVVGITDAVSVDVGLNTSCAVHAGGTASCWGLNNGGELGNGTRAIPSQAPTPTPTPVVGLTDVVEIATYAQHGCALRSNGQVSCWGSNTRGQIGDAVARPLPGGSLSPVTVPGISGATAMDVGSDYTCAVVAGGTVSCWGDAKFGQLGNGTDSPASHTTPQTVIGLTNATDVSAGEGHSCALRGDGSVWCWGTNSESQLGTGIPRGSGSKFEPTKVVRITDAVEVAAGGDTSCARLANGRVQCWGDNDRNQVTTGPWDVDPLIDDVTTFSTPITQFFR